jgi:hypothetical protein
LDTWNQPRLRAAPPPEDPGCHHPKIACVCVDKCTRAGLSQWAQWGEDENSCRGASCLEHSDTLGMCAEPLHPLCALPLYWHSIPQVIGLLDVFTPDETLDDFTDL